MAEADWFFGDVEYVYGAGLMDGTAETLFSPGLAMTRGMMVTVLGRCAGASASAASYSGRGAFVDVDAGAWYAPYVEWARESGIAAGVGDGRFDPDGSITRQDLAALLHRYAEKTGAALPEARSYAAFGDEAGIAGYARAAVEALHRAGVVSGKPGNAFDPAGTATRAEVAAMLHRFLEAAK
ncbi:MAG: S-layer homology domain-containing protein [Clostridiales bacterium]|nr:S-layer homology domain-containing protein [Clostridiales bacterium]